MLTSEHNSRLETRMVQDAGSHEIHHQMTSLETTYLCYISHGDHLPLLHMSSRPLTCTSHQGDIYVTHMSKRPPTHTTGVKQATYLCCACVRRGWWLAAVWLGWPVAHQWWWRGWSLTDPPPHSSQPQPDLSVSSAAPLSWLVPWLFHLLG